MNLTTGNTRVDIDGEWHNEHLYITLSNDSKEFRIELDDIDLEHFISTLINYQHERP